MDQVILVNEQDEEVGVMEKLQAHVAGKLHRAISVFIFNSKNEMLLQQRAIDKYHSGGLWTNTCCSHPKPGEETKAAAERRLYEEMGMKCDLGPSFTFVYKAALDNDLTEYEYDHVFTGITDETPVLNPDEAAAWRYESIERVRTDIAENPEQYTEWFKICIDKYSDVLLK